MFRQFRGFVCGNSSRICRAEISTWKTLFDNHPKNGFIQNNMYIINVPNKTNSGQRPHCCMGGAKTVGAMCVVALFVSVMLGGLTLVAEFEVLACGSWKMVSVCRLSRVAPGPIFRLTLCLVMFSGSKVVGHGCWVLGSQLPIAGCRVACAWWRVPSLGSWILRCGRWRTYPGSQVMFCWFQT